MIKIGLTGGIGSGKTLVSKVFSQFGIPVFNADYNAKLILNQDIEVISEITKHFGDLYSQEGINKEKFASIIFNNPKDLKKVNAIIHPKVLEYFNSWVTKQQNADYIIKEAAILFESNTHKDLDMTINVHADELVRINRVVKRDKSTIENVKSRIKNQISDNDRINIADFTIYNNGDRMLLPQILEIHNKILKSKK